MCYIHSPPPSSSSAILFNNPLWNSFVSLEGGGLEIYLHTLPMDVQEEEGGRGEGKEEERGGLGGEREVGGRKFCGVTK